MKKHAIRFPLFIMPLVFLLAGLTFNRTWFSGDPEYAYLLNGLNICMGKSVGHVDNPGTPVQIISACVLKSIQLSNGSSTESFQENVLRNPDFYVEIERKILVILNSLFLLLLGWVAFRYLNDIFLSLLLQVTLFTSSNLLEIAFTKVSPEPLLILISMILIGSMLHHYHHQGEKKWYPLYFGIISGLGLATKATFLPLVLIPLGLLQGKTDRIKYLLTIIPAFIVFTAPAIPQYPHMAKWFLGLSMHTGTYGQGETGIIDLSEYLKSIPLIIQNNLLLSCTLLIFSIITLVVVARSGLSPMKNNHAFRNMVTLLITCFLGILMVAKHYHSNHYLIPEISLTGVIWIFGILFLKESFTGMKLTRFIPPAALLIFIVASGTNTGYLKAANHGYIISNVEYDKIKVRLETEFRDYTRIYYYPVSINPYSALRWGNVYSLRYHEEKLKSLYPDGLFYNVWDKHFEFWETELPANELLKKTGNKILLVGGPLNQEDLKMVTESGIALKKIYQGRVQAIYQIDTANSAQFLLSNSTAQWEVCCTADSISADGKSLLAGDFRFDASGRSNERSRSGNYSIKLARKDSYGMATRLNGIRPGQVYRVHVWRSGNSKNSFLVAAAPENSKEFYLQNADVVDINDLKWEKIILEFTIPENYSHSDLLIYVWNNEDKPAFFDDLLIQKIH